MYVMAERVWLWGKVFDLKTQPDLFALPYNSRAFAVIGAFVGIISGVPWLVLGFKGLGELFESLSLGTMGATSAVLVGVVLMVVRQIWTIRMGMRGVVISDMLQGIVAYIGGTAIIFGLIAWLIWGHGFSVTALKASMLQAPGLGSAVGPLYLFAIIFSGAIGGWCWPSTFIRIYTADSVRSVQRAGALGLLEARQCGRRHCRDCGGLRTRTYSATDLSHQHLLGVGSHIGNYRASGQRGDLCWLCAAAAEK
jgi:SSS family solute:Na+ symporter